MGVFTRAVAALATLVAGVALAEVAPGHRDAEAIDVLKAMDAHTASMNYFTVSVESFTDAAIGTSLVISNPTESEVVVDRSGSLRSITSDGLHTSQIYVHDGKLTLFSDKNNAFSTADIPTELDGALLFALSEFQVETPLLDLLLVNSLDHFVSQIEAVVYLGDKRPIRGVDCHHIVIRGEDVDLQLFVEEGDNPVPRMTVMTLKKDLGRPRHEVFMDWSETRRPRASEFEFDPPEGAMQIEFNEHL
jgi:hypothetical protein